MSSPSRRTRPCTRVPAMTSCMRLRVRMNVDLPQPDGPMSAVTCLGSSESVTPSMAFVLPYQAERSVTSMRFICGFLSGESVATGGEAGDGRLHQHDDDE